ncbi:hypothetical protein D9M69_542640 [compost metagenome]
MAPGHAIPVVQVQRRRRRAIGEHRATRRTAVTREPDWRVARAVEHASSMLRGAQPGQSLRGRRARQDIQNASPNALARRGVNVVDTQPDRPLRQKPSDPVLVVIGLASP